MKTVLFVLFILVGTSKIYSQDTIHFLDNTIKIVKVSEINVDDVKYHRFDNLDGPVYVSNKNEIERIVFSNGLVEKFKPAENKITVASTATASKVTSNQNVSYEKIIIIDKTKLMHFGKPIGESRLLRLINNYPESEKKTLMMREYVNMKSFKKKQYIFGFVGLGAGVGLAYFGMMATLISGETTPMAVGVLGGVSIGVTGAILANMNKQKRNQKKIQIANIYNN